MVNIENFTYSYAHHEKDSLININLKVQEGQAILLTGASGSGKTTILRALCGLIPHYFKGNVRGNVLINNKNLSDSTIEEIAKQVGYLNQNPEQGFFALEVKEELLTPSYWHNIPLEEAENRLEKVSKELSLTDLLLRSILDLSSGEKQKVALGSLLMNPSLKILLLDEPSANLDEESIESLKEILYSLKIKGFTIIIADHRFYWLKEIIDKTYILKEGAIVKEGDFSILKEEKIREEFHLRDYEISKDREIPYPKGDIWKWENINFFYDKNTPYIFENFSGSLPNGICALLGKNGSGKTTFSRLITGIKKPKEGNFFYLNKKMKTKDLNTLSTLVVQNVDHYLHASSVKEEVKIASKGKLSQKEQEDLLEEFQLINFKDRHPQSLSMGQKQRLVCACALASPYEILILDEPSSGLDERNMNIMGKAFKKSAEKGKTLLLISHDQELIYKYADYQINLSQLKK